MIARVSSKGQIVIPNEIRKQMQIKAGSFLEFKQIDSKHLEITVIKDPINELHGIYEGKDLTRLLEQEHREEIERDELHSRRLGSTGMARQRKRSS